MSNVSFVTSSRVRRTIYSDFVEAWGVKTYSIYNNMLLAANFRGLEEDYAHLLNYVQLWDVAVERQIVVEGPDARKLLQLMVPRDVKQLNAKKCFYAPIVTEMGKIINDPIVIQVRDDKYYLSIASSDVAFYAEGLKSGFGLDCVVYEGDVDIMALQGPLANDLMTELFGDTYAKMPYFGIDRLEFEGQSFIIAKSGWSKQGGFEIYCDNAPVARKLWQYLAEKGKKYNIGPGGPHWIERIEGGLLSYGNDMTCEHSPLEAGLKKFMTLDESLPALSIPALLKEQAAGSKHAIFRVSSPQKIAPNDRRLPITQNGQEVGFATSMTPSPKYGGSVGFAMCELDKVNQEQTGTLSWRTWQDKAAGAMDNFTIKFDHIF